MTGKTGADADVAGEESSAQAWRKTARPDQRPRSRACARKGEIGGELFDAHPCNSSPLYPETRQLHPEIHRSCRRRLPDDPLESTFDHMVNRSLQFGLKPASPAAASVSSGCNRAATNGDSRVWRGAQPAPGARRRPPSATPLHVIGARGVPR